MPGSGEKKRRALLAGARRLMLHALGLPVAVCVVCGRVFVPVRHARACDRCRQLPEWRHGNYRRKQQRQAEVQARAEARRQARNERHAPVLELRAKGYGYKRIGRELGMSRDAVRSILRQHEHPGGRAPAVSAEARPTPAVENLPPSSEGRDDG